MTNRDEYFFDIANEAGLDILDPNDWINIGILFSDPRISESEEG